MTVEEMLLHTSAELLYSDVLMEEDKVKDVRLHEPDQIVVELHSGEKFKITIEKEADVSV